MYKAVEVPTNYITRESSSVWRVVDENNNMVYWCVGRERAENKAAELNEQNNV